MYKEKTLWISYSAISLFSKCPHSYYLGYEYRNPNTGNRIQIVNPYLSLGSAVHETIEGLIDVPVAERTKISLTERFKDIFSNYKGLKGGFISSKKEEDFKERGLKMVERVEKSMFLEKPSTKIKKFLPTVNLIGEDVKLVGNIDWVEILPSGKAHIIDFKTGNNKESSESLQLPIYLILAEKNLSLEIEKVSYWYLQHDDNPAEHKIGKIDLHLEKIKEKANAIKRAIETRHFPCRYNKKCFSCKEYEDIFNGNAELIGTDSTRKKDIFCIIKEDDLVEKIMAENFLDEKEKEIFRQRVSKEKRRKAGDKKNIKRIKEKIKENLSKKELKVLVNLLKDEK